MGHGFINPCWNCNKICEVMNGRLHEVIKSLSLDKNQILLLNVPALRERCIRSFYSEKKKKKHKVNMEAIASACQRRKNGIGLISVLADTPSCSIALDMKKLYQASLIAGVNFQICSFYFAFVCFLCYTIMDTAKVLVKLMQNRCLLM